MHSDLCLDSSYAEETRIIPLRPSPSVYSVSGETHVNSLHEKAGECQGWFLSHLALVARQA
jgi:hypothetical protein